MIMRKIIVILSLFVGLSSFAQNVKYAYLEVKNSSGFNFLDVKLTYDRENNCYNNIQLFTESQDINIYFQIYLNDKEVYSGWAKMNAGTNYFLDDAFYNCNSSYKDVLIKTQPRFE